MNKQMNEAKDQLVDDFKLVVADTEALLKATANQSGEKISEIRAQAEKSLQAAKEGIAELQSTVVAKTKEVAEVTDVYVHENPWKSVGFAAAVGLAVGLLIGRRH
jgi:ElaB/YqjD/DUF883 family membrane-anchored ribosome-binding protein